MKKERDTRTIEAEMQKRQEQLKKAQNEIRSLNAELTTAKKREKARRYAAIGSAIEKVLGVGELSNNDLNVLIYYLEKPFHSAGGSQTTMAAKFSEAIKAERAKVSAAPNMASNRPASAASKPEAVPSGRQGFTGTGNGSPLPTPAPAKP